MGGSTAPRTNKSGDLAEVAASVDVVFKHGSLKAVTRS
jgi:hypothetical protein